MMIMVAYFLGTSYVFKTRQYIVIEFLFDRIPGSLHLPLYLLAQALVVLFCVVLVFQLLMIAESQLSMRTVILHIPRFYGTVPLLLASISMIATAIYYALAIGRAVAGRPGTGFTDVEHEILINQPVGEI